MSKELTLSGRANRNWRQKLKRKKKEKTHVKSRQSQSLAGTADGYSRCLRRMISSSWSPSS